MGSTARGLITGFICRLCSKMNRYVILIYGEEGEKMGLADKINLYLPVTVTRNDPLPKTVCPKCVDKLEEHSRMVQVIKKVESEFNAQKGTSVNRSSKKPANVRENGSKNKDSESESERESESETENENEHYFRAN